MRFVGSGLKDDVDWADVALRVVTDADAVHQSGVNQVALKARIGLLHDERKNVGSISRGVVFADRRTLPANLDQSRSDRLLDDAAFALLQRRMLDQWKLHERIFLASRPVAEELLGHLDRRLSACTSPVTTSAELFGT